MSTPSETIRTATSHGSRPDAKLAIVAEAPGSSEVATRAVTPKRVRSIAAIPRACSWSVAITSPPASGCSRRTSASRSFAARSTVGSHSPSSESAVRSRCPARAASSASSKRGRVHRAVRRRPLHVPVRAREVDGPHDAAVGERVRVAVLVVGHGLVAVVRDERDRARVGTKRRAGEREPAARAVERLADRGAPGPVLRRVVQLVEDDERAAGDPGEQPGARRDLLVRGDDAVHVGRQRPVRRRPGRVEVERERRRGAGPLELQVRRRRDDDEPRRVLRELVAGGRQRERRLAGARGRDREEVPPPRGEEGVERGLLPRSEPDGAGHESARPASDPHRPGASRDDSGSGGRR